MKKKPLILVGIFAAILILFSLLLVNWNNNKKELADNMDEKIPTGVEKINELSGVVFNTTSEILKIEGYRTNRMFVDSRKPNPYIEVIVNDENELSSIKKQEVQELVSDTVYLKTNILFNVTVRTKSVAELLDEEWQPIFSAIRIKTDEQFEEYRGFAYSFFPAPMQIIIETHLKNTIGDSNLERVEKIEEFVEGIIEKKREELSIEDLPYKIIVLSKENEELK